MINFTKNWQLPILNQWKGDYDGRNNVMINFANNWQLPFLNQWKGIMTVEMNSWSISPLTDNCPSWISKRGIMTVEIMSWSISPITDNCPSWISKRGSMTAEMIPWSISAKFTQLSWDSNLWAKDLPSAALPTALRTLAYAIATDKRGYPHDIFLISPWKHMLWVLIRSASPRRF